MFEGLIVKIIKINILCVDYISVNNDEDRKLFAVKFCCESVSPSVVSDSLRPHGL